MPETVTLSDAALALLNRHLERQGNIAVDDSSREPYRELARCGLMVAGHSFTRGREAYYKLTDAGWERRFEDQSQFSHHFKRLVGVTPGQFRTFARIA